MREIVKSVRLAAAGLVFISAASCKKETSIPASADFQKKTQEALITAKPGTVIRLPKGTFHLDSSLQVSTNNITIKGEGMDQTILSFKGQKQGAEGILASGNNFTIEDLSIQDSKGDALKVNNAKGVTIRRVKTEWTGGPHEDNGAYGIYPVQCQDVLVEDSVAIAASDAGIYVGQSKNIIVRRNRAELNVAGIEIENSTFADVYDNVSTKNTGGILVFDLPDLKVQGGQNTRVYNNQVYDNNTDNFAKEGNIVALVPTGTGLMIMANDNIEIFRNTVKNHRTVNMALVSYFVTRKPIKDEKYDPYPEGIHVHDNVFEGGGDNPSGLLVKILALKMGKPFPTILWDGIVNDKKMKDGKLPDSLKVCIHDNGSNITFANIDAKNDFKTIQRDLAPHNCKLPPLEQISIPGVK